MRERAASLKLSELLTYLAMNQNCTSALTLPKISETLGINVARLREQLEVARVLGVVEVRPKTGIKIRPYAFAPAVQQSLTYAIALNPDNFQAYADLRKHVEAAYWYQAVQLLTVEDVARMRELVASAMGKVHGRPAQFPHEEHRELHMLTYRRLNNPFLNGVLEAYWEVYEAVGLNVYTDLNYLEMVWNYHEKLVEAIANQAFDAGYQTLIEHMDLIAMRPRPVLNQNFE